MGFRSMFREGTVQSQLMKEFMTQKKVIFNADEDDKNIHLNVVVVPEEMRRKGQGTKFMNRLKELAKEQGKTVTLNVSDMYAEEGDPKADDLEKWYKSLGFKMVDKKTKKMKL